MFYFDKPKKSLMHFLFFIGILLLSITILAGVMATLWVYYPDTIDKVEKVVPDYYGYTIKSLYKAAKQSEKNTKQQYIAYNNLYEELKEISTLNKYYSYRQESTKFLINYHLKNKQYKKALKLAEYWKKNYPYDFLGKFVYINVLSTRDKEKGLEFYQKLYYQHKDIDEVKEGYISYLIKHEHYNTALKIINESTILSQYNARFRLFYIDNKSGFSEGQSAKFDKNKYKNINNTYKINFSKKFNKFKSLRLDVDAYPANAVLSEITAFVKDKHQNIKLKISSLHDLIKLGSGNYNISGQDPFFIFSIPDSLKNYSGRLEIFVSIKIDKSNSELKSILENPAWKFFANTENGFNEKKSTHFILKKNHEGFTSKQQVEFNNTTKIRIDLPSLISLKLMDIKLTINNNDTYNKKDIVAYHNIRQKKNYIEVIGNDPFFIINLNKNTNATEIQVDVKFTESDNE